MPITLVVILRSIITFFVLLVLVRLMGKQQVAQLTFFDYVVGITIGSMGSTLSVQVNENFFATLAGLATWTLLAIALAVLSMHSVKLRKLVDGKPTVVIRDGKILEDKLNEIRIPIEELLSELRTMGVFNIADVQSALFEPGGKISVQKKFQKQPVTPGDLNISPQYQGLPISLILDGVLLEKSLHSLNLTKAWLHYQLKKQNITDVAEISLAQLDTQGNLYVDLQGDKPCYTIQTRD